MLLVPAIARADELVVGALRDQDGAIVAGASVTALDAQGTVLARDHSGADGTFALTSATRPAAVVIVARYADPLRIAVPADGSPITAIVRRHRAADLVPSAADVAALPAGTLGAVAEVAPYRIAVPGAISDRWNDFGRGVTTVEGLPFYRLGDGGDITGLLPAHAFGAIGVTDPLQALWYGDRAGGGIVDARLFDRADADRLTDRDAAFSAGNDPAGLVATSWDADGMRRLVAAHGSGALGPVAVDRRRAGRRRAGDALRGRRFGAADRDATDRPRRALRPDDLERRTRCAASSTTAASPMRSSTRPVADRTRSRCGSRWRDERSELGDVDSEHRDGALVLGTTRGNAVRVTAAVAVDYGADASPRRSGSEDESYEAPATNAFAVLPSLNANAALSDAWTLHAGFGDSTLGTPGYALARSALGEVGLAYDDHHRLRAEVLAYAQGEAAPAGLNRGFGLSLGWEIAPRLSLRAWSLRDVEGFDLSEPLYPYGPPAAVAESARFDRDLVWLTWDAPVRVDLLLREGALEGNLRIPLDARYALTLGSYRNPNGTRTFSAGVVRH